MAETPDSSRFLHESPGHSAKRLRAGEFVILRRVVPDMVRIFSHVGQNTAETESRDHETSVVDPGDVPEDMPVIGVADGERALTAEQFQGLARMPPEVEWFANITNANTRRAYRADVRDFMRFVGIARPEEFRVVTRAHVIAWRDRLLERGQAAATLRRRLSALASLFDYLCDRNAVNHNPCDGVKRPNLGSNEGKSPALGDEEARALLDAPPEKTVKGLRDRALLATLLYHGLRRAEVCGLTVGDVQMRRGVPHFQVRGKGGKVRYLPIHPGALGRINDYLAQAGHGEDVKGALFRPVKNPVDGNLNKPLSGDAVFKLVRTYCLRLGLDAHAVCVHGLRATAATNALDHQADIAKVQEWLGHASISTTRLYDRRQTKAEDSPTFRVSY